MKRWFLISILVASALLLAGCGAGEQDTGQAGAPPTVTAPTSKPSPQLYEASATVLDDRRRGPMLCLGMILTSLPPQCGDVPIANWDWAAVEGEHSQGGTTWGDYHVVGTYDGRTFTVAEVGPHEDDGLMEIDENDFSPPCPEPEGGWVVPDPERSTQDQTGRAEAYARAQPDHVTSWVHHLDEELQEFSPVVLVVVFTGEAERHETDIRKVWNGPLCVVAREVSTARELARIRGEVEAGLPDLGLQMLWSQGPGLEPTVEIGVVADPNGAAQKTLDERYGQGIVRLHPFLRPVSR
jgi:hypothetical protein